MPVPSDIQIPLEPYSLLIPASLVILGIPGYHQNISPSNSVLSLLLLYLLHFLLSIFPSSTALFAPFPWYLWSYMEYAKHISLQSQECIFYLLALNITFCVQGMEVNHPALYVVGKEQQ
jgi:hypothetical protein